MIIVSVAVIMISLFSIGYGIYTIGYIDGYRKERAGKVMVYIVAGSGSWEKSNGGTTIRFSEEQMN